MFSVGSYAKVWEVKRIEEKYIDLRISTSKKDKDGKYEQDFGSFVRLVGKARTDGEYLNVGDSFKIVRCGVENRYDKEKKQTYTNFIVFELEIQEKRAEDASLEEENPFIKS